VSHLELRSSASPLRSLIILFLTWSLGACSSSGDVCADYGLYSTARPGSRLAIPEGMALTGRDGSTEIPGVGPEYQPVVQTRCMSRPPDPFANEAYVASVAELDPSVPGPLVAQDEPAAAALGGSDAVLVTVYTWASLWAAGDLDGYRALYAGSFSPPRGADQATWDRVTANRVRASGPRTVDVYEPSVRMISADRAEVRFRVQERRAGGASTELRLRMLLIAEDGVWRIAEEESGPG
jgi:hypothetical protein